MRKHVISPTLQSELFKLENSFAYHSCRELLSDAIADIEKIQGDHDLYELGAANLKLSIYHLICGEEISHSEAMEKAKAMLPEADLLALAANWLARSNTNEHRTIEFCMAFFDAVDEGYRHRDGISKDYFDSMIELRDRLPKI